MPIFVTAKESFFVRHPHLLVIDDEPRLGEFLASIARDSGFTAEATSTDTQFRRAFLAATPALVALDLGMPGMDGIQLLRFLAGQKFKATVLIISGFDRRVLDTAYRLGEALGLNMAGPIEKPVRADVLERAFASIRIRLAA